MLTTKEFQKMLLDERGITLSRQSILRNVRNGKIKSVKGNVGERNKYMIPIEEINKIKVRFLVL